MHKKESFDLKSCVLVEGRVAFIRRISTAIPERPTPTDAIGFDEHCPPGAIAHEQILVSRASRCA